MGERARASRRLIGWTLGTLPCASSRSARSRSDGSYSQCPLRLISSLPTKGAIFMGKCAGTLARAGALATVLMLSSGVGIATAGGPCPGCSASYSGTWNVTATSPNAQSLPPLPPPRRRPRSRSPGPRRCSGIRRRARTCGRYTARAGRCPCRATPTKVKTAPRVSALGPAPSCTAKRGGPQPANRWHRRAGL